MSRWFLVLAVGSVAMVFVGLAYGAGRMYGQGLLVGLVGFPLFTALAAHAAHQARVVSGRSPQIYVYLGDCFVVFVHPVLVPRVRVLRRGGGGRLSIERPLRAGGQGWILRIGERARWRGSVGSDTVAAEDRRRFDADVELINAWLAAGAEAKQRP